MIKIAFCDDDRRDLEEIRSLLQRYQALSSQELVCTPFYSPLDLLADMEAGERYDILFLDILMPGENGMDVAAEIRNYDRAMKIIFLTSSPEYAVQSYTVGAYDYQLKPLDESCFFRLMDSVLSSCERERNSSLILHCRNGIMRVELDRVEYCEIIHRTLVIHMANGRTLESVGCLDDLDRKLRSFGKFLRVHRSYLVNLDYVEKLSYRAITMSCQVEIPIPRGKYTEIKQAFLEHAFQNREVIL